MLVVGGDAVSALVGGECDARVESPGGGGTSSAVLEGLIAGASSIGGTPVGAEEGSTKKVQ